MEGASFGCLQKEVRGTSSAKIKEASGDSSSSSCSTLVRPHLMYWVKFQVSQHKRNIKLLETHPKEGYKDEGSGGENI